jgi:hypothetical protein
VNGGIISEGRLKTDSEGIGYCMNSVRKTTIILTQYIWSVGSDLGHAPPEYKAGVPPFILKILFGIPVYFQYEFLTN